MSLSAAAALILAGTIAPHKPLTANETKATYVNACLIYEETGDEEVIEIRMGVNDSNDLTLIECEDFENDVRAERAFRVWYLEVSKRLGLHVSQPGRPCYDYRAFFAAMVTGKAWFNDARFPKEFETACPVVLTTKDPFKATAAPAAANSNGKSLQPPPVVVK